MTLAWKIGFEVEVMAPGGKSRRDLAGSLARSCGGRVGRCFSPQSEPSKVPGIEVFESLTLGFDVLDSEGALVARLVDDLTLQRDLDRARPSRPDWYRILSDDRRILRLIDRNCDAESPIGTVLEPLARLFGTRLQTNDGKMFRVVDDTGASVAIAAPLPGERERPCEIVTVPLSQDHEATLEHLLGHARALGFTVPHEAAVHLHFDAAQLCAPPVFARLVDILDMHGAAFRRLVGANPNCRRLGPLPDALFEATRDAAFLSSGWDEARLRLADVGLTKYCDFNLANIINAPANKHTFEVRILPGSLDTQEIIRWAMLFEGVVRESLRAGESRPLERDLPAFISGAPMALEARNHWEARAAAVPAGAVLEA